MRNCHTFNHTNAYICDSVHKIMFDIELLVSPSKEADIRLPASMVINASYSQVHNSYQGKNIPNKQEVEHEVAEFFYFI